MVVVSGPWSVRSNSSQIVASGSRVTAPPIPDRAPRRRPRPCCHPAAAIDAASLFRISFQRPACGGGTPPERGTGVQVRDHRHRRLAPAPLVQPGEDRVLVIVGDQPFEPSPSRSRWCRRQACPDRPVRIAHQRLDPPRCSAMSSCQSSPRASDHSALGELLYMNRASAG